MKFSIKTLLVITVIVALIVNCYRLQRMIPKPSAIHDTVTLCVDTGISRFSHSGDSFKIEFFDPIKNSRGNFFSGEAIQTVKLTFLRQTNSEIIIKDCNGKNLYFVWKKTHFFKVDKAPSWWQGWELFDNQEKELFDEIEDYVGDGP